MKRRKQYCTLHTDPKTSLCLFSFLLAVNKCLMQLNTASLSMSDHFATRLGISINMLLSIKMAKNGSTMRNFATRETPLSLTTITDTHVCTHPHTHTRQTNKRKRCFFHILSLAKTADLDWDCLLLSHHSP